MPADQTETPNNIRVRVRSGKRGTFLIMASIWILSLGLIPIGLAAAAFAVSGGIMISIAVFGVSFGVGAYLIYRTAKPLETALTGDAHWIEADVDEIALPIAGHVFRMPRAETQMNAGWVSVRVSVGDLVEGLFLELKHDDQYVVIRSNLEALPSGLRGRRRFNRYPRLVVSKPEVIVWASDLENLIVFLDADRPLPPIAPDLSVHRDMNE